VNSTSAQLRIGLAQINPTVGDLISNRALILDYAEKAQVAGVHLLVFPEMVLTGYPVEDLALRATFRKASRKAIAEVADSIGEIAPQVTAVVGYLDQSENGSPQNAVAVIHRGQIIARYIKHHLPNYGVFDEFRNFVPGSDSLIFRLHGIDVGVAICEDIWHYEGPVADLAARKPGLVVVPNGSPFERDKDDRRAELVSQRAREIGAPLAYVNMTGGQDDLVFDGDTVIADATGAIVARAPQFDDGLMVVDIQAAVATSKPDLVLSEAALAPYKPLTPGIAVRRDDAGEIWEAVVVGLRDYVEKNGFKSVLLGLSGGIDSAVVAAIAADAIGPRRVYGVSLPSKYSSDHSRSDAKDSADRIGLHFSTQPIQPMVDSFIENLGLTGLAEENVQARVRGTTLMGLSNQDGHLVLATGNKSELAVGYSTLYGDAVGGYAPIKDLLKMEVWAIARWRNAEAVRLGEVPPIPESSINKEPSAELRPDQKDSDSLPDYPTLDRMLTIYIDQDGGLEGLLDAGFSEELAMRTIRMVDRAEYKRRQYPPGPKVSARAFGKDRRLPITSHWTETN
jgi:NAD+ synthase (glutamine-hydrolysing)